MAPEPSANTLTRGPSETRPGPAWIILALICACQFMVILDTSIVNVALPSVQRDLHFSDSGLPWVVNGYLLPFAGFMLIGGRAADLFGRRWMLLAGLSVFSVASLVDGLATLPGILIGARALQGLGAAMLAPATLAVLNTTFTSEQSRARAFGAWSSAGGVGGMAGALAGGVITTGISWRWVFLINVPVGAVLITAAVLWLTSTQVNRREPLDLLGGITGTVGLSALVYGVMQSPDYGWSSGQVIVPLVVSAALLVAFVVLEARSSGHPMMPLRLFRVRTVAVGDGMLLLFGGIAIAMWFFTSFYLQDALGYSALRAGLGQTPAAVVFMLVARQAGPLLPRTGVRPMILVGCACFIGGFGWLAQANAASGYFEGILGPTLLIALGIGLVFPTLMATATADVPPNDAGIVSGLAATTNQVGGSIGLAVLATIASDWTQTHHGGHSRAALASGYDVVFLVAAGFALAIALLTVVLPRRRGADDVASA